MNERWFGKEIHQTWPHFVDVLEGFVWYVVSAGVAQRCPLGKVASIGHAGQAASCRCQRMDVIMLWYLLPALGGRFPRNIQRHQNEPAAITFQACEDPQDDLEERFRRLIGKNVPHQDSDRERSVEKSYLCKRNSPDLMLPLSMWLASALKDQPPSFQAQKRQEEWEMWMKGNEP